MEDDQVMSDFLEVLTHARRFKAAVKELSLEDLQDLASKLSKIIEEREESVKEEEAAMAERVAKIEEIRKQMEEVGLSLDDLGVSGTAKAIVKKRAPRPAKYQIESEGETVTWTGQGRMPKVFKTQIDAGHDMEEFLI